MRQVDKNELMELASMGGISIIGSQKMRVFSEADEEISFLLSPSSKGWEAFLGLYSAEGNSPLVACRNVLSQEIASLKHRLDKLEAEEARLDVLIEAGEALAVARIRRELGMEGEAE